MSLNLCQKINLVMKEVQTVVKNAEIKMGGGSYKAVSHDSVTSLLHLPVANAGLVLLPNVESFSTERISFIDNYGKEKFQYVANVVVSVTVIDSDDMKSSITLQMPAIAFDQSDKAYGKAVSMATKYCYLKLFMLESIDEEEQRIEPMHSAPVNLTYEKKQGFTNSKPKVEGQKFPLEMVAKEYVLTFGKFKGMSLGEINKDELANYVAYIKSQGSANETVTSAIKAIELYLTSTKG